jgi:hypothetical protein
VRASLIATEFKAVENEFDCHEKYERLSGCGYPFGFVYDFNSFAGNIR